MERAEQAARPDPREQGRTDTSKDLLDRLSSAPLPYIEGALANPALDEGLAAVMLRNAGLTEVLIQRISRDERFSRSDAVKAGLVRHPATPRAVSMHLVKFLHWRDLAALGSDREMPPVLRTLAEQTLGTRLSQLPSGLKASLARTGGRGVLVALLNSRDLRVIPELLRNPRMTERDVTALARARGTASTVLGVIARDEKWSRRPQVRLTLVMNHATPLPDALRLLPEIATPQLRRVRQNPRVSAGVRAEATRLMQKRTRR